MSVPMIAKSFLRTTTFLGLVADVEEVGADGVAFLHSFEVQTLNQHGQLVFSGTAIAELPA